MLMNLNISNRSTSEPTMSFMRPSFLRTILAVLIPCLCLAAEPAPTAKPEETKTNIVVSGPTTHASGVLMSSISSTRLGIRAELSRRSISRATGPVEGAFIASI